MDRDEIDINKINEKYGNSTKQLANWIRSLTVTDYGYKYLKKEGYTEDQIADWVRRTPAEKKVREVRPKSSPENSENLLRTGENSENLLRTGETEVRTGETSENLLRTGENLLREGENSENSEDETLRIPKPEENKGTQSSEASQSSPLTFSHNPHQFSPDSHNSQQFSQSSQNSSGEKLFSQNSHLSKLSPQQLSSLGMMRDGKGDYFHVTNIEDGGYHLSPATQEILVGAVAGVQRQAQQAQPQTQQNEQSTLMKKTSENAVDEFSVIVQAIVRIAALSLIVYVGFTYLQGTINHLHVHIFQ